MSSVMPLLKELCEEEKPREKFALSPGAASMADLVAILLRTGTKGCSVLELARRVIHELEDGHRVPGYEQMNWRDLTAIPGIGRDKAVTLCAAVELGRRLTVRFEKNSLENFGSPEKVARFFMERLRHENQEHFLVCYLNVKNRFLGEREVTIGNLHMTPVDIQEIFRWGLRYKAYGMILVHNHPSGCPEPSDEDVAVTRKIAAGAALLDMKALDHVIIGDGCYVSLHERDVL